MNIQPGLSSPRGELGNYLAVSGETDPADAAGEHQSGLGCRLLVVTFRLLDLRLLLGVFLLRLNLLVSASHPASEREIKNPQLVFLKIPLLKKADTEGKT